MDIHKHIRSNAQVHTDVTYPIICTFHGVAILHLEINLQEKSTRITPTRKGCTVYNFLFTFILICVCIKIYLVLHMLNLVNLVHFTFRIASISLLLLCLLLAVLQINTLYLCK